MRVDGKHRHEHGRPRLAVGQAEPRHLAAQQGQATRLSGGHRVTLPAAGDSCFAAQELRTTILLDALSRTKWWRAEVSKQAAAVSSTRITTRPSEAPPACRTNWAARLTTTASETSPHTVAPRTVGRTTTSSRPDDPRLAVKLGADGARHDDGARRRPAGATAARRRSGSFLEKGRLHARRAVPSSRGS